MRTLRYPPSPLGTPLLALAAAIGVGLSLLFAVSTLPILALYRIAAVRRSADRPRNGPRDHPRERQTRSPQC